MNEPASYPIYLGGEFQQSQDVLEVINPYNQKVFAKTFLAAAEDLNTAIEKAQGVEEQMRQMPAYRRYELLMQISAGIREERNRLALILCRESAKPITYALAEIDRAAQTFLVAAEEAKRLPKEYISLDWTPSGEEKEGLVKYFPVGLVAGISPFNFPMNLAVHKIAPAIASGCPIVLKPASATPLSTLALAQIIDKTILPKGAVSILPMNRQTGNMLVTDDRFKLLSFTGSPEIGWKMKSQAGKKKVVLELGGNAGVIVTPTANLETAVKKGIGGGFAYSGQICIHAQRFYVHESIFDRFTRAFIKGMNNLELGNPEDPSTIVSVMIDKENADRVEAWVNEAISEGAQLLAGGKKQGSYYEPTLLTNTRNTMKVCSEEVFGPVVVIEPYQNFEAAVLMINDTRFGLQAGVFTNELGEADYALNHIQAGGIILNDVPTLRLDHMPYGGVKDSGLGREGVKYAIRDMMEARILVK